MMREEQELVATIRSQRASLTLTRTQAKLFTCLQRIESPSSYGMHFTVSESEMLLEEALLLLECALIERKFSSDAAWKRGARRAGEILEWLSHPNFRLQGVPIDLFAAAAYQLSGFPAMAASHIRKVREDDRISILLCNLLKGSFAGALESVTTFWKDQYEANLDLAKSESEFQNNKSSNDTVASKLAQHSVMCIGTLCAYLRTGNAQNLNRALVKQANLANCYSSASDPYSLLLAKLTAAICEIYSKSCIRSEENSLTMLSSKSAAAFEQYCRASFLSGRMLVWPAQSLGISCLKNMNSFVLCTPTGSGKTTVATLAVVQSLFGDQPSEAAGEFSSDLGSLVLYLVPSRALAAEVESKFTEDLRGLAADPVVVTGLYGGADWGPTDAWVSRSTPTILICTFEKAEALIRFLGVFFLNRVQLVIVDEAHTIQQARLTLAENFEESRAFRLEKLVARLLGAQAQYNFRIIALSAVAAGSGPAMARWITGNSNAAEAKNQHRSTRQLLGRIEIDQSGQFSMFYDLMDGVPLSSNGVDQRPSVSEVFPRFPQKLTNLGPEKAVQLPTLWAALHLAAEKKDGSRPCVLISITQHIASFAENCIEFLESLPENQIPSYAHPNIDSLKFSQCLASIADYFDIKSVEYRLLEKGIGLHYGRLPSLLSRRLKSLIDAGLIRLVIATSTLSEGVNIPVNYLLLPNVRRANADLSHQEFANLIGRVGRPGVATEGQAFIVLPAPQANFSKDKSRKTRPSNLQRSAYEKLFDGLTQHNKSTPEGVTPRDSALAHLLKLLRKAWRELVGGDVTVDQFANWLEETAVSDDVDFHPSHTLLDSLDGFLITSIEEIEQIRQRELTPAEVESELIAIWRRTYAFATLESANLSQIWLKRGAVVKQHYPEPPARRRIYRSGLPPRSARELERSIPELLDFLKTGEDYSERSKPDKIKFIAHIISILSKSQAFRVSQKVDNKATKNPVSWQEVLQWWLSKESAPSKPRLNQLSKWHAFIQQNFVYRSCWGLGSAFGLILELGAGSNTRVLEIADWPKSGLPWISFWLKELLIWGTLDPVAAYLLARTSVRDRKQAEERALAYYRTTSGRMSPDDALDPRKIRDWTTDSTGQSYPAQTTKETAIEVHLSQPKDRYLSDKFQVFPIDVHDQIFWIDPSGYELARSPKEVIASSELSLSYDFILSISSSAISRSLFLRFDGTKPNR